MEPRFSASLNLYIRSTLYWLIFLLLTVIFGTLIILLFFIPSAQRVQLLTYYGHSNLWFLKKICNLDYEIKGIQHLTDKNAIVLCKHQSIWETIALLTFIPHGRFVFKRELMFIPFFGWALALTDMIAINRSKGRKSVHQLVSEGTLKLQQGKWILLFPEGTRTTPGTENKYKIGGALLAEKSGYPVLPIAHNAGDFWLRNSMIKLPGTITVHIGPSIESVDKNAQTILDETKQWIEYKMTQINKKTQTQL